MRHALTASLAAIASAALPSTATACPVDFSGTGVSDEYITLFCAKFEQYVPTPQFGPYYYFDVVNYYSFSSRLHDLYYKDDSYPDRHIP